jgi:hypothetical protein
MVVMTSSGGLVAAEAETLDAVQAHVDNDGYMPKPNTQDHADPLCQAKPRHPPLL